jgi:hypothetical protein
MRRTVVIVALSAAALPTAFDCCLPRQPAAQTGEDE